MRFKLPAPRIIYALLFYVLSMALLFVSRPPFAFREDGSIRPFGVTEDDATMYSVGVMTVVLAIASFFVFCWLDTFES